MSCPICYTNYDDSVSEQRCYNICGSCGYGVCKSCAGKIQRCPNCRGSLRSNPIFTRVNNTAPEAPVNDPMEIEADLQPEVVLLIDISGSMNNPSSAQPGAPLRVELAIHMAKVMLAFCQKLKSKCVIYTFSEMLTKVAIHNGMPLERSNDILNKITPEGQTFLGLALGKLFQSHGRNSKYFVFTDGEPTDDTDKAISSFDNTQLHLLAFGKDINTGLLRSVASNPKHTISYVEDIKSLAGYMVPVFIWAMTDMKQVTLDQVNDECRKKYVEILAPQVGGSSTTYKFADLINLLKTFDTPYARDLLIDTIGIPDHGRIKYSFQPENWHTFGKFYLLCILHCHKNLIPGNAFDPSLKYYRSEEYSKIFEQIAGIPISIKFVPFMTPGASSVGSTAVQKSFQYIDSFTTSGSGCDDGCIGPNAVITLCNKDSTISVPMKDVSPGNTIPCEDRKNDSKEIQIKWILRISNLNRGNEITLYNGLTGSHPVMKNGKWIKAKHYENATITHVNGIVYDVILEDAGTLVPSMKVNGIDAAVIGYPVPGMIHPYWGSDKVVEDIKVHYPDGGFVDIDAKRFTYTNGLVSGLF